MPPVVVLRKTSVVCLSGEPIYARLGRLKRDHRSRAPSIGSTKGPCATLAMDLPASVASFSAVIEWLEHLDAEPNCQRTEMVNVVLLLIMPELTEASWHWLGQSGHLVAACDSTPFPSERVAP